MFPDMSSYAKRNRLGPHYKPSKSVMGIYAHPLYNYCNIKMNMGIKENENGLT